MDNFLWDVKDINHKYIAAWQEGVLYLNDKSKKDNLTFCLLFCDERSIMKAKQRN